MEQPGASPPAASRQLPLLFRDKLQRLRPFLALLLSDVREEFTERLRTDTALALSYFPRYYKRPSHTAIPLEALVEGLETALERETNADLAEAWALAVAQDWILKHESIYDELESKFHELGIDFESEQKELGVDTSRALLAQALPRFGPLRCYLFVVLNSVLLNQTVMHELLAGAEAETKQTQKQKKVDRRKQLPPGSGGKQQRRRRPSATMQRAHTDSDAMAEGRWRTDSLSTGEADDDLQGGGGGGVFYHFGEEEEEEGEEEKEDYDDNDTSRSHSFYSESDGDEDDNNNNMFEKMQCLNMRKSSEHIDVAMPRRDDIRRPQSAAYSFPKKLQSHSDKTTPVKRAVNILRTSRGSSFILPRSDDEFLQHFRSQYVEGYLEKRKHTPVDNTDKPASGPSSPSPSPSPLASAPSDDASNWTRKWAVLDHAKLYYYDHALSREEREGRQEKGCIPLLFVNYIRTAPEFGSNTFEIGTFARKFVFRAATAELAKQWLLGMHCSIAQIVSDMVSPQNKLNRQRLAKVPKWWKQGHYHAAISSTAHDDSAALLDETIPAHIAIHTSLHQQTAGGLRIGAVLGTTRGQRPSMEDEHSLVLDVNAAFNLDAAHGGGARKTLSTSTPSLAAATSSLASARAFFGIYDGHGGVEAATFVKDRLLPNIVRHPAFATNPRKAVQEAFLQTDREFEEVALTADLYCGTTALVVLLQGNRLITANLGDCRAVLCNSSGTARPLSIDHKPSRPEERKRIEAAGGWVVDSRDLNMASLYCLNPELINEMSIPSRLVELVGFVTTSRLCGELSVSRAFGDIEYKGALKNEYWGRSFTNDLVTAEPDIFEDLLSPHDQFILLACDGLWDVFGNQEAVDFVRAALPLYRPEEVMRRLIGEALGRGSMDNISCLLVLLPSAFSAPVAIPSSIPLRISMDLCSSV